MPAVPPSDLSRASQQTPLSSSLNLHVLSGAPSPAAPPSELTCALQQTLLGERSTSRAAFKGLPPARAQPHAPHLRACRLRVFNLTRRIQGLGAGHASIQPGHRSTAYAAQLVPESARPIRGPSLALPPSGPARGASDLRPAPQSSQVVQSQNQHAPRALRLASRLDSCRLRLLLAWHARPC